MLGHLQRGGAPTTFDRVLATQYGAHAVRLIVEKKFGEMICYNPPEMGSVPIIDAVHQLRTVDPDGPAVQAARALGISFGDCDVGAEPVRLPRRGARRRDRRRRRSSTPSSRSTSPTRRPKKRCSRNR